MKRDSQLRFYRMFWVLFILFSCDPISSDKIANRNQFHTTTLDDILIIFTDQYSLKKDSLLPDQLCRSIGEGTNYHDELNYVRVIMRVEEKYQIDLDEINILDTGNVGFEMIPAEITPRILAKLV